MNRLSFFASVALVAGMSGAAHAQACNGYTPFSVGPMRAAADFTLADQAKVYNASFGIGQSNPGWFGGASVTGSAIDGLGETRRTYGFFGGYSMPIGGMRTTEFCPVADVLSGWSPGHGSSTVVSFGAAVGHTIVASPTMDVIPFGDLRYHSRERGTLALGAGIVFSKTMTLRPAIMIPVAHETASTALGISFGYNFGK